MGIFSKIFNGLKKTKNALAEKLKYVFTKNELDEDFFEELEYILVSSDIDHETVEEIVEEMRDRCKKQLTKSSDKAREILKEILVEKLTENEEEEFSFPLVIMVLGVIPFSTLYLFCIALRRSVSDMARSIDGVTESAYIITVPLAFRAALPMV